MAKGKYAYRIQQNGEQWVAEITRKASAKKTVVSKKQGGFKSEVQAEAWAKQELASFLETLAESHKTKALKREREAERIKEKKEDAQAQRQAETNNK